MWGNGVTSSITLIVSPAACKAVIADSRPEPVPHDANFDFLQAKLRRPVRRHFGRVRWSRERGVLLRLPLKPTVPAEA